MCKRILPKIIILTVITLLSACVTQNFENDDTPVVENESNNHEIAMTRISLGLGYLKMGNMPQAKLNLEKAKRFAPNLVQVHTAFAHYYETVGEHKLTVDAYEKALSIKSDDADTLNNYGVYLCRQNQVEEAEKQFLKAIAVPSYILVSQSYENLAQCQLRVDNFDKAEFYLNKAILHNPSSASTLAQMVRLQYAMGQYSQARIFEQRFEKMTRRFTAESLALAYKVYFKLGERRIAKNYGTMLVKMFPQSWEAKQYLLNDLAEIEADQLAKRFKQTSSQKALVSKPNKRVVVLSPKRKKSNGNSGKQDIIKPKVVKQALIKETPIKPLSEKKISAQSPSAHKKVAQERVNKANNDKAIVEKITANVNKNNKNPAIHIVIEGDTLYGISIKYNIKMSSLRRWNGLKKSERLYVGNVLLLIDPKTMQKN